MSEEGEGELLERLARYCLDAEEEEVVDEEEEKRPRKIQIGNSISGLNNLQPLTKKYKYE